MRIDKGTVARVFASVVLASVLFGVFIFDESCFPPDTRVGCDWECYFKKQRLAFTVFSVLIIIALAIATYNAWNAWKVRTELGESR